MSVQSCHCPWVSQDPPGLDQETAAVHVQSPLGRGPSTHIGVVPAVHQLAHGENPFSSDVRKKEQQNMPWFL